MPSRRGWIRIAAGLLVIYLGAIVGLGLVVRSEWFVKQLRVNLEKGMGRRVAFSTIEPSLWRGVGVTVDDFTLYEKDGETPFLQSDQISLSVRLLPLLWKKLSVGSISLERPRLALVRDKDGRWNFESLAKKEKPAVKAKPGVAPAKKKKRPGFHIAKLRISDGLVTASDPSWRRKLIIKELNIKAANIAPGFLPYIDGRGRMEEVPVDELLAGVKELRDANIRDGLLSGTVRLKGWVGERLRFWTKLKIKDIHLNYGSLYASPRAGLELLIVADGDGSYKEDTWNVRNLNARCLNGRIDARGSMLGLGQEPELEMRVSGKGVPWSDLGTFNIPRFSLGGKAGIDAFIEGKKSEIKIDAALDLSGSSLSCGKFLKKPAGVKTVVKFPARFAGNTLVWEDATVRCNGMELKSGGSVCGGDKRIFKLSLKGSGIDMGRINRVLRTDITLGGEGELDLSLEQMMDRPFKAAALSGNVKVTRGELRFPGFKNPVGYEALLNISEGNGRLGLSTVRVGSSLAEGHIDFAMGERPTFEFDFHCPLLDSADFSAAPAAGKQISGFPFAGAVAWAEAASPGISPGGPLLPAFAKKVKGVGRITIGELRLGKLRAGNGRVRLRIEEGIARTEKFYFSLYGGEITGVFAADASGSLPDYALRGKIADVDLAALLSDSYGYGDRISGKLFADCEAAGRGRDWRTVQGALVAKGSFSVKEGRIRSFGFMRELGPLFILLGRQAKAKELVGFGEILVKAPEDTRLSRCEGNFTFQGGRWGTGDLLLEVADKANPMRLQIEGTMSIDGSIDLLGYASFPRGSANYAQLARYFPDDGGWIKVPFPIPIGGTLGKPRVNLESAEKSIVKCAAEIAKLRLRKEVEKKIDEVLTPGPKKDGEGPDVEDMGREILKETSKELLKKLLETK